LDVDEGHGKGDNTNGDSGSTKETSQYTPENAARELEAENYNGDIVV
jgi:hypothetical protein